MCLLYFCPFKTALNKGSKEIQEDGRGCGGISWAMSGIQCLWTSLKLGSITQGTGEHFLEAEGYWGAPFLLLPSQLMLSQLHFTVQGRNSLVLQSLGEHWKIASCQSSSKKQICSNKFEQFMSEWYFYLYGNAQIFQHRLYFCINSKWMIS